ncbi:hypothetical protein KP79_PYT25729 [Mizuhopecten yessoensis]|uniref:Uncharacterized protein n=1 Tax=Mizuhopecten yessoensis TaxID=6573 RepID=A0A210QLR0_MIZYE|nr:hypothetical protein KP79_PYT25729 [Mizuhopecten yessoensis]
MSKTALKNHRSGTFNVFISEDLTTQRQKLIGELSRARKAKSIASYWTNDGRIFFKVTMESAKVFVKSYDDIAPYVPHS